MLDNTEGNGPNDIAIVGMALRVPGARSVEEFWTNLTAGRESVRTLSQDELTQSGKSSERMHHPNYVRRAADLAGMEAFDAEFFGLSPKEAAIMDPQHRQFLECAWEAMEDAGQYARSSEWAGRRLCRLRHGQLFLLQCLQQPGACRSGRHVSAAPYRQ